MKIAFVGTHGVGKTILCSDLSSLLRKNSKTVVSITELSREAVNHGLPLNEGTTISAQGWILLSQMAREIEAKHNAEYVVCDRAVIDNYIYMMSKFKQQDFYEMMVLEWLEQEPYDFLFKVPICVKLQKDGVRSTDPEFQKKIDKLLDEFLEKYNIPHIRLPETTNPDEWLEIVKNKVIKQKSLDEF